MIILFNSTAKRDVEELCGKHFDWIVSDLQHGRIWKVQDHNKMDIFRICSS